jgi:hypothetical protein
MGKDKEGEEPGRAAALWSGRIWELGERRFAWTRRGSRSRERGYSKGTWTVSRGLGWTGLDRIEWNRIHTRDREHSLVDGPWQLGGRRTGDAGAITSSFVVVLRV